MIKLLEGASPIIEFPINSFASYHLHTLTEILSAADDDGHRGLPHESMQCTQSDQNFSTRI